MLESLHVKNLALIEEIEINFHEGFNVLTGETGAGKSIVLGSVNLALGAKASPDVIRTGAEGALVELVFDLNDEQVKELKKLDIETGEDNELLLQRKIMPTKSVCRINGETVSMGLLKECSSILLDMYGQHEHQSLLKASTYSKMLDEYAGSDVFSLQAHLKKDLAEYKELVAKKDEAGSDESVRKRELELLSFEVAEIEEAALKTGEDEELEKRYKFLNNAKKIMESVSACQSLTGSEDNENASSLISLAVSRLKAVSQYDEEASALTDELGEIDSLLNDFNHSLRSYIDKLSFDEEDFHHVEERLNLINKLKDKYADSANGSIESILKSYDDKLKRIDVLTNFEDYLDKLNKDINEVHKKILDECKKISDLRIRAASTLKVKLEDAIRDLNFLDVKLEIKVEPSEDSITSTGFDNVEFLISLNPGESLRPIRDIASGGELSRIMLAFKSVFASASMVPTLIFDEIDAGISGVTAYKVAEKIGALSRDHQILCITHLPQIAAMATSHYLIEKAVNDGRTVTDIHLLTEEGSVNELARMLGSDVITEASLENAKDLKKKAADSRK